MTFKVMKKVLPPGVSPQELQFRQLGPDMVVIGRKSRAPDVVFLVMWIVFVILFGMGDFLFWPLTLNKSPFGVKLMIDIIMFTHVDPPHSYVMCLLFIVLAKHGIWYPQLIAQARPSIFSIWSRSIPITHITSINLVKHQRLPHSKFRESLEYLLIAKTFNDDRNPQKQVRTARQVPRSKGVKGKTTDDDVETVMASSKRTVRISRCGYWWISCSHLWWEFTATV